MGMELVLAVTPAIVITFLLYVYFSARFREHGRLLGGLREHLDRQERELAALERQTAKLTREMKQLSEDMIQSETDADQHRRNLLQRFEALEKEYDMLEKKMDHVQSPEISGENAKQLIESPLVAEILGLLNKGVSPMEIAQRKGMQVGEVALIKSLQKFSPKE